MGVPQLKTSFRNRLFATPTSEELRVLVKSVCLWHLVLSRRGLFKFLPLNVEEFWHGWVSGRASPNEEMP